MKKFFHMTAMVLACASLMTACDSNQFKKTDNGLLYRFETTNTDGRQPQMGEMLVGEMTIKLDTVVLISNVGHPDRLMQVRPDMFKGDINEGLQMMHVGDKAVFAIPADSLAQFIGDHRMPPNYKRGVNQMFYYEIALADIVSVEDLQREQTNLEEETAKMKEEEPALLAQYIQDNNITVKPTASGLYIVVKKKGNGPKVSKGKTVSIDYTGRLLDGTIFDSSREADAREAGKYNANRPYEPLTYQVGAFPLIPGWDEGVDGQPEGTELTLIMPSKLGYGERGAGNDILPYSPLVFDLTIVSVK